jgi:hypothetical protein
MHLQIVVVTLFTASKLYFFHKYTFLNRISLFYVLKCSMRSYEKEDVFGLI